MDEGHKFISSQLSRATLVKQSRLMILEIRFIIPQAKEEWRVVTSYIEEKQRQTQSGAAGLVEIQEKVT
jgi:hypothetical protein